MREEDRCRNDYASIGHCGYLEKFIAVFFVMDTKYSNLCGIEPNVTCSIIGRLLYFVIKKEVHLPPGAYHVVFANE